MALIRLMIEWCNTTKPSWPINMNIFVNIVNITLLYVGMVTSVNYVAPDTICCDIALNIRYYLDQTKW